MSKRTGPPGPEYVHWKRPRCPSCGSTKLKTRRSKKQPSGAVWRSTVCLTCGVRFILIVE